MKKFFSMALAVLMTFSAFALFALSTSAAGNEVTVYLSDNGDDQNNGKTAATPVKTLDHALELVGEGNTAVLMITDIYSVQSANYYLPYLKGGSVIFRGVTQDSVFAHARGNYCLNNPTTFDNLTYKVTSGTWARLCANYNRLEITESVKVVPYNGVDDRVNYPCVYGGEYKGAANDKKVEMIINGGEFNYIVAGCKASAEIAGNVSITIGGNAKIIQRVYLGNEGSACDILGDITLTVKGGTIGMTVAGTAYDGMIYCGGCGTGDNCDNYVSGNITVKLEGGDIRKISCTGCSGATYYGKEEGKKITVDYADYEPAKAAGWIDTNVIGADETFVVFVSEHAPETPEETEEPETPEKTEEPETPVTPEEPEEPEEPRTPEEPGETETKGCRGTLSALAVIPAAFIGISLAVKTKKED